MVPRLPYPAHYQVLLRLQLRSRKELLDAGGPSSGAGVVIDQQAALRQELLDCLRLAPTGNLRQNVGLKESMEELLQECKTEGNYNAAASVKRVLDLLEETGVPTNGDEFLQTTANEISKLARRRVQLMKERSNGTGAPSQPHFSRPPLALVAAAGFTRRGRRCPRRPRPPAGS